MSLIITATDFTAVGKNAVNYACNLAIANNAEVLVVHTYVMPVMLSDIALPNTLINDTQKDADSHVQHLVKDLSAAYPDLAVKGKVVYGDVIDALDEYKGQDTDPWLVVIGNDNTDSAVSFESTLMETLKNSKYPVLAVPPSANYKPVEKICFAYDNKYTGSSIALQQLIQLTGQLKAELHVLYADSDVSNRDNSLDIDEATKTILSAAGPKYHFMYDSSIEKAIQTFIKEQNIDWLIVMPRKHSFFEGIFHKSHTKAMAHTASIPIVALHENL